MKTYIICSTQRSGSTLFCETLIQTNHLGKPTEKLLYYERSEEKLNGLDLLLKKKSLAESLRTIMMKRKTKNDVSGIKLMMSTLETILRSNNKNILQTTPLYGSLMKNYSNPLFIFWKRGNKIKQAISHAYLKETNVAHAKNDEDILKLQKIKENIDLSMEVIHNELKIIFIDELKWKMFFAQNNISPIILTFEDFLLDKEKSLVILSKALNLNYDPKGLNEMKMPLKKVSNQGQDKIEEKFVEYLKKSYSEELLLEYDFDINRFY